jgi:hypothetical protein
MSSGAAATTNDGPDNEEQQRNIYQENGADAHDPQQ